MAKDTSSGQVDHNSGDVSSNQASTIFSGGNGHSFLEDGYDLYELMLSDPSLDDELPEFPNPNQQTPNQNHSTQKAINQNYTNQQTTNQTHLPHEPNSETHTVQLVLAEDDNECSQSWGPFSSLTVLSTVTNKHFNPGPDTQLLQSLAVLHDSEDAKVKTLNANHNDVLGSGSLLVCNAQSEKDAAVIPRCRHSSLSNDSGVESCNTSETSTADAKNSTQRILSEDSLALDEFVRGETVFDSQESASQSDPRLDGHLLQIVSSTSHQSINDVDNGDDSASYVSEMFSGASQDEDSKNSSKKTAYNEKWGVKVLKAWCLDVGLATDFENLNAGELNELLCRFWGEVRKSNGDYYGRNSLFNLRAMINKHLKSKPFCSTFDIVTDERFRTSNEELEKQLKLLKGIGRTITHKQPISMDDFRRMYDSKVLSISSPLSLLRKVWFEITLHFCHKGAEAQEKLKKTTFAVFSDRNGLRYVARNSPGMTDDDEVRMYEAAEELCPVRSFELYLSKLHPQQPRLFQQPRRKSTPESPMWYGKAPIGEKALQQMMANISAAAHLSKRYTNHCVRTTALEQFSAYKRKGSKQERCSKQQNLQFHSTGEDTHMTHPSSYPSSYHTRHTESNPCPKVHQRTVHDVHITRADYTTRVDYSDEGLRRFAPSIDADNNQFCSDIIRKRGFLSGIPNYPPPPYNPLDSFNHPSKRGRSSQTLFSSAPYSASEHQRIHYISSAEVKEPLYLDKKICNDRMNCKLLPNTKSSLFTPLSLNNQVKDYCVLPPLQPPSRSLTACKTLTTIQRPNEHEFVCNEETPEKSYVTLLKTPVKSERIIKIEPCSSSSDSKT